VIQMRNGEHYFAGCARVGLAVLCLTELTFVSGALKYLCADAVPVVRI